MGLSDLSLRVALVLFGLVYASLAVAQSITVATDSALHEEPKADSRVVTQLKSGAAGEMIGRQGAWVNLKTASGTGWVLSFNVRFPSEAGGAQAGGGTAGGLGRLLAPRSKAATTATIGIRGLEAEDLKSASFNQRQMNLLEKFAVGKAEAERAARETGLEPVRVEYLNP